MNEMRILQNHFEIFLKDDGQKNRSCAVDDGVINPFEIHGVSEYISIFFAKN